MWRGVGRTGSRRAIPLGRIDPFLGGAHKYSLFRATLRRLCLSSHRPLEGEKRSRDVRRPSKFAGSTSFSIHSSLDSAMQALMTGDSNIIFFIVVPSRLKRYRIICIQVLHVTTYTLNLMKH